LLVTLGGQNISFSAISVGSNYTSYGGNIPLALAGQLEQLTFSTPPYSGNNAWEIDDIQFSSSSVPEPDAFSLLAVSVLFVYLASKQPNHKRIESTGAKRSVDSIRC
jgi:hypothetical protein